MRILIQGRDRSGEGRGGDSTVASHLGGQMRAVGHEVVVTPRPPETGLGGFDVVHLINLDRSVLAETELFAEAASRAGVRMVVTPLWWPLDRFIASMPPRAAVAFRARGLGMIRMFRDRRLRSLQSVSGRQAAVLAACAAVCPSGEAEAWALQDRFGPLPVQVVHFGTDRTPVTDTGVRSGVLCVARLDPRKNQLGLITALRGTGIALQLVGTDRIFPDYAAKCRDAAGDEVEFRGFLPEEELHAAHRNARVHALPSWFELPGLVSLDAAVLGAAVVVSRAGTPGDYFGKDAEYCGNDQASIRQAVLKAYETGPPPGLAERIAARFSWKRTATGYLGAYHA